MLLATSTIGYVKAMTSLAQFGSLVQDGELSQFRRRAVISYLIAFGPPILVDLVGFPDFLFNIAILVGVVALIYLTAITVSRLRILGQSTWWALLMVPAYSALGPVLYEAHHGSGYVIFTVGSLLGFMPVLACCFLRKPKAEAVN